MIRGSMATPKEIERSGWEFFNKVIEGLKNRPSEFDNDKDMAKATGVGKTSFCEYKTGRKGHEEPGFIMVWKLAYILKGGPPCTIGEPADLSETRLQTVRKKDDYGILDKILAVIVAGDDIETLAAIVDVYYKRTINSPQEARENS